MQPRLRPLRIIGTEAVRRGRNLCVHKRPIFGHLSCIIYALHTNGKCPKNHGVKSLIQFTLVVSLTCLTVFSTQAAYTSLHVFGDSISTTATNSGAGPLFYGKRYSNGRVWVEVLAQMQGIPFDPAKNVNSFFGNTSDKMLAQVKAFARPADAAQALVVIWVNNADLYYPALDSSPSLQKFNAVITVALTNQFKALTNLYSKGIRTIVMPNVVDISTVPQFNTYYNQTNLFSQASKSYNNGFYAMLENVRKGYPDLKIIVPDFFSLLNNMLSRPQDYGLVNAKYNQGHGLLSIDALSSPALADNSLNGPGASYIFWDPTDPTAKVHYIMASVAQQLVSPVRIDGLTQINGSNRLDLVNLPLGMDGSLENTTNLTQSSWATVASFSSTQSAQSVYVPTPPLPADFFVDYGGGGYTGGPPAPGSGGTSTSTNSIPFKSAAQFYRLQFPYRWVWP